MNVAPIMESIRKKMAEAEKYKEELAEVQQRLDYLKKHVDITKLKPASGTFRLMQLDLMHFTQKFLADVAALEIKPFLCGGNLIGAFRHKGFVPWDDDFDFGLMREDYERLKDFCKRNFVSLTYQKGETKNSWTAEKRLLEIKKLLQLYPSQYIFEECVDQIQIFCGTNLLDRKSVDFWAYDFYAPEYTFEEHQNYLQYITEKKIEIGDINETISFLENEILNNPNIIREPGKIYFGIDNIDSYVTPFNTSFIDYDTIFPLQKVPYENSEFLAPNDILTALGTEYRDFMSFPADLGLQPHLEQLNDFVKIHGLN